MVARKGWGAFLVTSTAWPAILAAAEKDGQPQVDLPTLARLGMALVGVAILGMVLLVMVMGLGRWARKLARHEPRNTLHDPDEWARKPLAPPIEDGDQNGETT